MKKKHFEIGFIGGAINSAVGTVHKIASQMDGKFKLVAGCFSKDPEINKITAEEWDVDPNRVYNSWELLLEKELGKLDAIIILTPTPDHGYMIEKSLKYGYPVISEKSITESVGEAKRIKDIVNDLNGFLTITFNYTGYPIIRELKKLITKGQLGKINQVLIEMPQEGFIKTDIHNQPITPQNWRLKDYEIPTISLDLGVHVYSLIHFLIHEEPVEVCAVENTFGLFDVIVDDVHAIAKFTNNIICNIWYSKSSLGNRNGLRIRIYGTNGSAEWFQMNPEELILCNKYGEKKITSRGNNFSETINDIRYNRFKAGHPSGFIEAFANLYSDIYDALCNYKSGIKNIYSNEYTFTIDDGLKGLIFLDAMHKSYIEKKWIHITE